MMINLPVQISETNTEPKYQVTVENNSITYSNKNFNVPILIKAINGQVFSPGDKLSITVNNFDVPISVTVANLPKNNYFEATLVIPTTERNKKIDLILNLSLNNQEPEISTISVSLPDIDTNSIVLSTSAIVGIVVTIVVTLGLTGWIIYLVKKRKQQKVIDRYHNKRKKNL